MTPEESRRAIFKGRLLLVSMAAGLVYALVRLFMN
jgi:hypothetical protein